MSRTVADTGMSRVKIRLMTWEDIGAGWMGGQCGPGDNRVIKMEATENF
jgi:hypothetical protein